LPQADGEDGPLVGMIQVQSGELRQLQHRNRPLAQDNKECARAAAFLSKTNRKPGGFPQ